ncbi:MAG: hypothetical protein WC717_03465 [Candidatus Micrarchaeia archaeon]|jgi:hypothetical protein
MQQVTPICKKMRCNINNEKSLPKLTKRYGRQSPQPKHAETHRTHVFYRKIRKKALEAVHSERRNGKSAKWNSYFFNSHQDSTLLFNELSEEIYPGIARHIKKKTHYRAETNSKLMEVARRLSRESGENQHETFKRLMGLSLRIKIWVQNGKAHLHYREINGEKVLGFLFPNSEGTQGGFVSADCHFHGTGLLKVSSGSVVLGSTTFVGRVLIIGTSLLQGRNRLEGAFVLNSKIEDSTIRGAVLYNSVCSGSFVEGGSAKNSAITDSKLIKSNISKFAAIKSRLLVSNAVYGTSKASHIENCGMQHSSCSHSWISSSNVIRSMVKASAVLDCEIGPRTNLDASKVNGRIIERKTLSGLFDEFEIPQRLPI